MLPGRRKVMGRLREGLHRKLAFVLAGGMGFALYFMLSMLLVRWPGFAAGPAALLATLASIPPTFALQRRLAFRDRSAAAPAFVRYCLLQALNAVMVGLLARAGQRAGLPEAVNFLASGSVVVVVSYLVLSRLVFRGAPRR